MKGSINNNNNSHYGATVDQLRADIQLDRLGLLLHRGKKEGDSSTEEELLQAKKEVMTLCLYSK
jgi:hypothetical protein